METTIKVSGPYIELSRLGESYSLYIPTLTVRLLVKKLEEIEKITPPDPRIKTTGAHGYMDILAPDNPTSQVNPI